MVAKRGIYILAKGASGATNDGEVRLSHRGKLRIFRYRYLLHRGLPHNLSSPDWICCRGYRTDQVWRSLHTGVDGSAVQGIEPMATKTLQYGALCIRHTALFAGGPRVNL